MVRRSFVALERELRDDVRNLVTKYGGVLVETTSFKGHGRINPESLLMSDPMTKLREYVEQSGFRMIDLLKTFDRDNNWQISKEELTIGVKVWGVLKTVKVLLFVEYQFSWISWSIKTMNCITQQNAKFPLN